MVFEDADVSIQIFDLDLGAAVADTGGGKAIGAKDDFAAVLFFGGRAERHCGDGKVAVDSAVERLEAKIGGEATCEEEIDVAIDRLEAGVFLWVAAEADLDRAVDSVRETGAAHTIEFDVAIHVARHEVAVHVAYDDAAFVDGTQVDTDIARDVEDEIHFHNVAIFVATTLAAAAVFAIAAERAIDVELEAAVGLRDVEIDFFMREGERLFRFGARIFVDDEFNLIAGAADDFDRTEDVVDFDGAVLAVGEGEGFLNYFVIVDREA